MRRRSNKETSTTEAMVIRGRSTKKGKNKRGTSRSKSKGNKSKHNCWFYANMGISRRIVGNNRMHPKRTS